MTTIYIVTNSTYDDYQICAIFSSQVLAEAYIAKAKTDPDFIIKDFRIEEYPLDPE